jgi:hypothetical protein
MDVSARTGRRRHGAGGGMRLCLFSQFTLKAEKRKVPDVPFRMKRCRPEHKNHYVLIIRMHGKNDAAACA